jgi:hypothetical protein
MQQQIMQVDFDKFVPEFREKLDQVVKNLEKQKYEVKVIGGFRTLKQQAKAWKRGKSVTQINFLIDQLKSNNAPYSASIFELPALPPQTTWISTEHIFDYHLLGKAATLMINNVIPNIYHAYNDLLEEEAFKNGLVSGFRFKRQSSHHIRLDEKDLEDLYTMAQMDEILKELDK